MSKKFIEVDVVGNNISGYKKKELINIDHIERVFSTIGDYSNSYVSEEKYKYRNDSRCQIELGGRLMLFVSNSYEQIVSLIRQCEE